MGRATTAVLAAAVVLCAVFLAPAVLPQHDRYCGSRPPVVAMLTDDDGLFDCRTDARNVTLRAVLLAGITVATAGGVVLVLRRSSD